MEVTVDDERCTTPKHWESRIPEPSECPPAPRKKPEHRRKIEPPKSGYFRPPDLDALFALECAPEARLFS